MSKEEEVMMEAEAVRSVYGDDDCTVLSPYPPHIRVHVVPRTAYVTSQQFVEADIEIQATSQYPDVPPAINVVDSKGLDEDRLEHLQSSLHRKAADLASGLMLVALCEEAVEKVSAMNHPDGNCPLCLYPLVPHDDEGESLPFMKLMSCFHCFHSACIIRWWEWLQMQNDLQNPSSRASSSADKNIKDNMRSCPICRKVFHVEDVEHVINLAGSQISELFGIRARFPTYPSMVRSGRGGHGSRRLNLADDPQPRERDVRDAVMDDLRRQVKELIMRLQAHDSMDPAISDHGIDATFVNPYHNGAPPETIMIGIYDLWILDLELISGSSLSNESTYYSELADAAVNSRTSSFQQGGSDAG